MQYKKFSSWINKFLRDFLTIAQSPLKFNYIVPMVRWTKSPQVTTTSDRFLSNEQVVIVDRPGCNELHVIRVLHALCREIFAFNAFFGVLLLDTRKTPDRFTVESKLQIKINNDRKIRYHALKRILNRVNSQSCMLNE